MKESGSPFDGIAGYLDGTRPEELPDANALREWLPLSRELAEQKRNDDLHAVRKTYLCSSFVFVSVHCGLLWLLLFCRAFSWIHLSDTVLVALLTTTTANVLGVLLIAFHWLFKHR